MGKYIRQKSGGGKVPKCITKDTIIIVYFILDNKKHCRSTMQIIFQV